MAAAALGGVVVIGAGESPSFGRRVVHELRRWGVGPGSVRLMLLRAGLLLVVAAPFTLGVRRDLSAGAGKVPELVDAPATTIAIFLHVVRDVSPTTWAALIASLLLWWLLEPWLAGTALAVAAGQDKPRVWRRIWDDAWPRVPALWRVTLLALPIGGAGAGGLNALFGLLRDQAVREGTDATHSLVVLPGAQALLTLGWWVSVGVFALWCRVLIMADGRRRVRRVVTLVPRIWRRAPLRAFGLVWLFTMALQLAGLGVIGAVAPDRSLVASVLLWAVYLTLHLLLWQGGLRAMRTLYAEPLFESVRSRPDHPWGWLARLWRRRAQKSTLSR